MNDTQEPTAAQKKENIIKALTIAGFTENPEYPKMYARDKGNIREIVDMTAGLSSHLYDIAKKQKILGDDATGTLGKLSQMIVDAEDGRMPTKSTPDEVVHVPKKGDVPPPESNEPEVFDPLEPAQDTTDIGDLPATPPTNKQKNKIKSVRVSNSEINIHDGENIGPGFGVIIDPMPTDADDIIQIMDDIIQIMDDIIQITDDTNAAVMAFNRKRMEFFERRE